MTFLDWIILIGYFSGMILLGLLLFLRQKTSEDYYLAGRRMPSWMIGASMAATQASAVSLIGGPAFVAVKKGGGLIWLQYELAVPLAMGFLIPLVAAYHKLRLISIYSFIESRFGFNVRLLLSFLFQLSRGLATGVSLYATALIFGYLLNLPILGTLIILGGITIIYTTLGGIFADILSDVIQLIVLWSGVVIGIAMVFFLSGMDVISHVPIDRLNVYDFSGHGFGDGKTYSFWAMLIGGIFLYLSYYGCDQTQAQRLLTSPNAQVASRGLLYNSVLRFPLVLTYLFFGIVLAGFIATHTPPWISELKEKPDALVPLFVRSYFPHGIRGLFLAAIMAASMSSFDSTFNSLSAATLEDLKALKRVPRFLSGELMGPRILTILWGIFSLLFASYLTAVRTPTVIELINMIGSVLYGPILSAFILGILPSRVGGRAMFFGILTGLFTNILVATFLPDVSWLLWNFIGCAVSIGAAYALSSLKLFNFPKRERTISLRNALDKALIRYMIFLFTIFFIVLVGSWIYSFLIKSLHSF